MSRPLGSVGASGWESTTRTLGSATEIRSNTRAIMLIGTIVGFLTVFQTRANAGSLPLRLWTGFVVVFALAASLALTLVEGPILGRLDLPVPEVWGILSVHILAVASFASVMTVLIGRWAILPTWLFFVVLGNSSSGGAVSPPLLPEPFAFLSQWLPSGATVTSLRDAIYFPSYQHARPLIILAAWAAVLFAAMVLESRRRGASPGTPDPADGTLLSGGRAK